MPGKVCIRIKTVSIVKIIPGLVITQVLEHGQTIERKQADESMDVIIAVLTG